jgi:hypothetical protein
LASSTTLGLQPVDNAAFTAVLACTDATAASVKAMTRRLPAA